MLQVGHYILDEELKSGALTALYRGHRIETGARVLVRVLTGEHPSPRQLEVLRHAYAMARKLPIRVVVQPLALEEHGHSLLLVLADPGGQLLDQCLHQGLDLMTSLQIAVSLAKALNELHQHHVIHKDIQPENILVDPSTSEVYITGLGIATQLSQETHQIKSPEAIEGSLAYMSPEQTGRMNRPLDLRTDLYAFGVVLYQMLIGVLPFDATDAMEQMHALLVRKPLSPCDRNPRIPTIVSNIVMKLLSKAAEDRYQSALGVAQDLSLCLEAMRKGQPIMSFPLGRHDPGHRLSIPQKLYGRQHELSMLLSVWQRASQGKAEVLLVAGYSGIGKSQLVNEIHKEIARVRGYFIHGKFDQLSRRIPYLPIARAFQQLVHQLLAEHADVLESYKEKILRAVGVNGRVLTDLVPDLMQIIGPQPEVVSLPESASRNRLTLVLQDFLRIFATVEHPLTIFLDDLQWVDLASLALLKVILSQPESGALFVIGAYRSNEVDAAHPLSKTLNELAASVHIGTLSLGPLSELDVTHFVADALHEDPSRIDALARVIYDKTQGNPFFLIQFLTALDKDRLLAFDAESGRWRFDPDQIRSQLATDNVSLFIAERIQKLRPETQRMLQLGACIGHRFRLRTLSLIGESTPNQTAADLWQALEEGVVVPVGTDYRFFAGVTNEVPIEIDPEYHFAHDRVQEAAYSLIAENERASLHLRIGRLMLARMGGSEGQDLFDVATHLNLGASLVTAPDERLRLAHLDLEAGRKARSAMATQEASSYLRAGIAFVGDACWQVDYELSFALYRELAECEALVGAGEEAESLHAILLAHAKTTREQAQVHELSGMLHTMRNRYTDAIKEILSGLRLLGFEVDKTDEQWGTAVQTECTAIEESLKGRPLGELVDAPRMTDPDQEVAMRLLLNLDAAAIGVMPNLHFWSTVKCVRLSLECGNATVSGRAYILYGAHLALFHDRHAEAYEWAKLGLALHDKLGNPSETCMNNYAMGNTCHYSEHWRVALTYFDRAYTAGLESGDFLFLSYTCSHTAIARILIGDPLDAVGDQVEQFLALMKRTQIATSEAILMIVRQLIKSLQGHTHHPTTLSDDGFDEEAFAADIERKNFKLVMAWYYAAKGLLLYLHGELEGAMAMLLRAHGIRTHNFTPEVRFYMSLAILALDPADPRHSQGNLEGILRGAMAELETWAQACNDNYLHELLLVQAERARHNGDNLNAMNLYDQAIAAAQKADLPTGLALCNEACAKFFLGRGNMKVARTYMTDACYAYARWGAVAKVRQLAEVYPDLVPMEVQQPAYQVRSSGDQPLADAMDINAFMRIQQTLGRELVFHKIIEDLMRIALQDAGAQRACLLLDREGTLMLEAVATIESPHVNVGIGTPVEQCAELPATVVRYVARVREPVVLSDTSREHRFSADPYIVGYAPKSIACLALTHQGRIVGVLYLENNAVRDVFTKSRVELLTMLLSQVGISIENAQLYARLQAVMEELRHANEVLEEEVKRRTQELHESNQKLSHELVQRKYIEEQRTELQNEIMRAQAQKLAELSTPVIPITQGIVVIPLMATLDELRSRHLQEAALEGVYRRRARFMVLDVTGLKEADARAAHSLLETVSALRLVGSEVIISGISPHLAVSLVEHSLDSAQVVIRSTLEEAIGYALSRMGQRWVRRPVVR